MHTIELRIFAADNIFFCQGCEYHINMKDVCKLYKKLKPDGVHFADNIKCMYVCAFSLITKINGVTDFLWLIQ